jgi:hypothetical protein
MISMLLKGHYEFLLLRVKRARQAQKVSLTESHATRKNGGVR